MNILVAGGAGYIGSHTVAALLHTNFRPIVYDNLTKGHRLAIPGGVPFIIGDIIDSDLLGRTIRDYNIEAVVHFAANSLVAESMQRPRDYYQNNVAATLSMLGTMLDNRVSKIVFSSTAAVYGQPDSCPIIETMATMPVNVYGRTKLIMEGMLADFSAAYNLSYVSLRYFNAAGAAADSLIGEDHTPETHLIPLVLQAALGQRQAVEVYGSDYPTTDGTCIRDYVHVDDLADAHVKALQYLFAGGSPRVYNLGTETGISVRQVIDTAKTVTGVDFPVREAPRRCGDPAVLVASSALIRQELGWQPRKSDINTIINSSWNWHKTHPEGYRYY